MLNVFTRTKPWMIASLLAATSVFAQNNNADKCRPAPKPPEPLPAPMTAAYNAPAGVDVRGCWDMYVAASFIYWQPLQDNMEFAVANSAAAGATTVTGVGVTNNVVNLSTNYKPGFEVGLGMALDYDNWDTYLQYTWFHNTNTTSSNGPTGGSVFAMRGIPNANLSASFGSASTSWTLKMDLADWQFARAYYVGTKLTFRPYFGARAAWIRQHYDTTYSVTTPTVTVSEKSTSWGIGPEAGLTANYMFGYGLRMVGDFNGDVLYTRYRTSTKETTAAGTFASVKQSGLGTVRAHTNMDLGFGWGTYFDNNNWHFDLVATYGFQVFWDQNMFRQYVDDTMDSKSFTGGNLYVQGLNLTARLDF